MFVVAKCACGKQYKVKGEYAGKAIKCPQCGNKVRVPAPAPAMDDPLQFADEPSTEASAVPAKGTLGQGPVSTADDAYDMDVTEEEDAATVKAKAAPLPGAAAAPASRRHLVMGLAVLAVIVVAVPILVVVFFFPLRGSSGSGAGQATPTPSPIAGTGTGTATGTSGSNAGTHASSTAGASVAAMNAPAATGPAVTGSMDGPNAVLVRAYTTTAADLPLAMTSEGHSVQVRLPGGTGDEAPGKTIEFKLTRGRWTGTWGGQAGKVESVRVAGPETWIFSQISQGAQRVWQRKVIKE